MPHNPLLKNTLITTLVFLKRKAEDDNLKPVITVNKLIDLLKSSGLNITYQQLVDLTKDPSIASSIKSINKNQVELVLGSDEAPEPPQAQEMPVEQPQEQGPEEQQEMPEETGEEDYNPDDFAPPEGNEEQENVENQPKKQESTVSMMAKRALARAD